MLWPRSTIFTSAGFDACALIAHVILLPARHAGCVVFSSSSPDAYITTGPSVHRTATSASIIMLLLFLFQCFRVDFFFRHGWRGRLSPKGDRHYQLTIESGALLSSSCLTHARQIANQLLNRFVSLSKRPLQVNSRSDLVEKSERSSWDGIVSRKLSATQWKCRRNCIMLAISILWGAWTFAKSIPGSASKSGRSCSVDCARFLTSCKCFFSFHFNFFSLFPPRQMQVGNFTYLCAIVGRIQFCNNWRRNFFFSWVKLHQNFTLRRGDGWWKR